MRVDGLLNVTAWPSLSALCSPRSSETLRSSGKTRRRSHFPLREFCRRVERLSSSRSVEYIGAGVAEIASAPIDTIVGKTFRLVQFSPTGAEFVEALTQVNGSKPTVEHLTPGKLEQLKSSPPPGMAFLALDAYLKELWGEGRTLLRGEDWKVESFPRITLVENVQSIRANPPKMPPMPPSKG